MGLEHISMHVTKKTYQILHIYDKKIQTHCISHINRQLLE